MKNTISIQMVSDVVCPWCYIGKKRLEKAIDSLANDFNFEIDFVPFELNPGSPNSDTSIKAYLAQKYGQSLEQVEEMSKNVANVAADEGIEMNFANINFTANTLLAHLLIESVLDFEQKNKIKEALLKAYFTDNVHIGIKENLVKIARETGLDEEYITTFINTPNTASVEKKQNEVKQAGINAVPSFIINGKYLIKGAQETKNLIETFKKIGNEAA